MASVSDAPPAAGTWQPGMPPEIPADSPYYVTDPQMETWGIAEADFHEFRRAQFERGYSIENWYEVIKDHTFPTMFIPLEYDDARAIIASYEERDLPLNWPDMKSARRGSLCARVNKQCVLRKAAKEALDGGLRQRIDDLARRLDEFFAQYPGEGHFMKTSMRSPKDVPLEFPSDAMLQNFAQRLTRIDASGDDYSRDLYEFAVCLGEALLVHNGAEAIYLLTRSKRICDDFKKLLRFGPENYGRGGLPSVILRAWNPDVVAHPELEFRGWLHDGKLTALSQYNDYYYASYLEQEKEKIVQGINEVLSQLQLPVKHAVIDFYCRPIYEAQDETMDVKVPVGQQPARPVARYQPIVIELNPFFQQTGACKFHWYRDREVLHNGPFEFRIVTKQTPMTADQIVRYVPGKWATVLHRIHRMPRDERLPERAEEFTRQRQRETARSGGGCLIS